MPHLVGWLIITCEKACKGTTKKANTQEKLQKSFILFAIIVNGLGTADTYIQGVTNDINSLLFTLSIKSLSPLDALNELVNPLCELEIDENMNAKGVLSGKYGILYTKVKNALERLEEYEKNKEF